MNKKYEPKTAIPGSRYFFYIFAGGIFLFLSAAVFIFGRSLPGDISANWESLNREKKETADLATLVTLLSSVDDSNLQKFKKQAEAALPDEKKTAGVVFGLTRLASGSAIIVNSLEFSPGLVSTGSGQKPPNTAIPEITLDNGVKAIPASLTVTSDINALSRFLEALSKSSQIIGVEQLAFSKAGGKSTVSINLLLYYQPPKTGTITWKQIQPITAFEQEMLTTLPEEDIFRIEPE